MFDSQHLGLLDYVIPEEYVEAMQVMFDKAPISSFEDVKAVIKEDLGHSLEEVRARTAVLDKTVLCYFPCRLDFGSATAVHRVRRGAFGVGLSRSGWLLAAFLPSELNSSCVRQTVIFVTLVT